jgi:hypothetical protein
LCNILVSGAESAAAAAMREGYDCFGVWRNCQVAFDGGFVVDWDSDWGNRVFNQFFSPLS